MEQWNRIQNGDIIRRVFVFNGRQKKAGNVRVRVFEHVGEDFRAGGRVELDGTSSGFGRFGVGASVAHISKSAFCGKNATKIGTKIRLKNQIVHLH